MPGTRFDTPPRVIHGAWWDSNHSDVRWPGALHINEQGNHRLELTTVALKDVTELPPVEDIGETRTFHGHDQHGRAYSLFGCVAAGSSQSTARVCRNWNVHCVVGGLRAPNIDEVNFDEVWVDFSDLQEWLCTPPIKHEEQRAAGEIVLKHAPEDSKIISSKLGYTLLLGSQIGTSFTMTDVSFQQKRSLSLQFDPPVSLRKLQPYILELQWFLSLGRGEPARVLRVDGLQKEVTRGEARFPEIIDVWKGWVGSDVDVRALTRWEMLFTLDDLGNYFGPMLERWQQYREKHAAVLSSYFSTKFNRHLYSNHRILFLAHALELYHQLNFEGAVQPVAKYAARIDGICAAVPEEAEWLRQRLEGANRKTLAIRLRELLEAKRSLIGRLVPDEATFVAMVKDTRNYYTHYDPRLKKNGRVAEGVVLMKLTNDMQAMMEALILDDLGAPNSAVQKVLTVHRTYVAAP